MMTETLMAVEPQEEEQTHPTPAAFVADEIPRLEPAAVSYTHLDVYKRQVSVLEVSVVVVGTTSGLVSSMSSASGDT